MRPFLIEVNGKLLDHSPQMLTMKNEDVIQAFSCQGAYEPFAYAIRSGLYGVKNLTMGINLRRRLSLVIVDDTSQDISPPYWTISVLFSSWN